MKAYINESNLFIISNAFAFLSNWIKKEDENSLKSKINFSTKIK